MAEQVRELFGQHRDRVWRDDQDDVWMWIDGKWCCYRQGTRASGIALPCKHFGPYTNITHEVRNAR